MNANSSKPRPPIGSTIRTKNRAPIEGTIVYYSKKHGTPVVEWDTGGVTMYFGEFEVIGEPPMWKLSPDAPPEWWRPAVLPPQATLTTKELTAEIYIDLEKPEDNE